MIYRASNKAPPELVHDELSNRSDRSSDGIGRPDAKRATNSGSHAYCKLRETMNADRSDDEIDALLAQGRFAAPTRDRVFEGALRDAGLGRTSPAQARRRIWAALGVSLAAGAAAVVLVPRLLRQDDGMRVKGAGGGPELDVACTAPTPASMDACPPGATLVFSIRGAGSAGGYLAGYAEPRAGGERTWYFSADGETPAVPAAAAEATAAFQRAIRVGPETGPGQYVVHLFLTRIPMSKSALLASGGGGDVLARREVTLAIVPGGT
jgi:hypothetical protein